MEEAERKQQRNQNRKRQREKGIYPKAKTKEDEHNVAGLTKIQYLCLSFLSNTGHKNIFSAIQAKTKTQPLKYIPLS